METWQRFSVERSKGVAADLHQELSDQDEGVKKEKITVNACVEKEDFWGTLFGRLSTWEKLRRVVAWIIRAARKLLQLRTKPVAATVSLVNPEEKVLHLLLLDVEEAERIIVKNVQIQTFPEELSNPNPCKGPLAKLKPFVNQGVLRVGGRLDRADLSYDVKHPMILPGKHRVTEMIILHYVSCFRRIYSGISIPPRQATKEVFGSGSFAPFEGFSTP